MYSRDLIKQLRQNNVNLAKVYSIIGGFLRGNGECSIHEEVFAQSVWEDQQGAPEQADDDVRKAMEVFVEMGAKDPHFTYRVQADSDGRIKNLMWASGSSRLHGDVITFDTTYSTNLYDMPSGLFVGVNNHFQSIILAGVLV